MKNKYSIVTLIFSIFAMIGLIFTVAAILVGTLMMKKQNKMVLHEAVINEITTTRHNDETSHKVYVDYLFDDEFYQHKSLGYYSTGMREGQYIDIYIDPLNPNDIMGKGVVTVLVIVFGILGGSFLVIGCIGIAIPIIKNRENARLFRTGKRIYGEVESLEMNRNVSVNNRHPMRAVVVVKDDYTGETKYYKGEDMWEAEYQNVHAGDSAVIYVDPKNEKKYFVDLTGANSVMGSTMSQYY